MTEGSPWENPLVLFLHYDVTRVGAMPWRKYLITVVEGSLQERETEAEEASEREKVAREGDGRDAAVTARGVYWPYQMPPTLLELVCHASVKRKECRTSHLHICPFMSTSTMIPFKWESPFPLALPYVDISTLFGAMHFTCSKTDWRLAADTELKPLRL